MSSKSYPRGSEWRKWDLHVHTPASLVNNFGGDWEKYLSDLEKLPTEFAVIGVNDYMFLDGYKRLIAEKANGRLKNIHSLFPVVEFRIKKFAGVEFRDTTRINLHVIFDPDLDPTVIESQFLNAIQSAYTLTPNTNVRTWQGVVTLDSLAALGAAIKKTVPPAKLAEFGTDLEEGFNNLNIDEEAIFSLLQNNTFLRDRFIIAIGKSEWDKIAWDDGSIAEKKDILNRGAFVFTAAGSVQAFHNAKSKLVAQAVNSLLLDCSDAHHYSESSDKDRIGNCFTWIKADPTFKGLLQVINEPADRCWIGDVPPKHALVALNKTKFITSISIERKPQAPIKEIWFDKITIPINQDLVAIIGNKGKGKSALTDIIGLLGNTKQNTEFTFLSGKNFRQNKDNKAKNFKATLTFESGNSVVKGLEESGDDSQPELVKYIPQNFLEKICTQIGQIEETQFDHELKNVIFSHVKPEDRLEYASLDELLSYKTSVAMEKIDLLKDELRSINEETIALEEQGQPEHREKIKNRLVQKQNELSALESAKPAEVTKPDNDAVKQNEIIKVSKAIDAKNLLLSECVIKIESATQELAKQNRIIATAEKLLKRFENLERQVQHFASESQEDLDILGLTIDKILKVTTDQSLVANKKADAIEVKDKQEALLDIAKPQSLTNQKSAHAAEIINLQLQLDEPNKKYQQYLAAVKIWEAQKNAILGNEKEPATIAFIIKELSDLDQVPASLLARRTERLSKAKEIHAEIINLANVFRESYAAVNKFIDGTPLAREKLHLNFEVSVVDTGFEDKFFELVNRGVVGSFCGVEDGHKKLHEYLHSHDFNTEIGIERFLNQITNALDKDLRSQDAKAVRVTDQIRKGKSVMELYDLVFSLDYLRPRYALKMAEKDLHELSPGERGALLLVFYLLVDKDDVPLIIDQPEENLDNQTVFELLVPCMKAAKQRRQVFIVTHNPNLAVVCDAEQIIYADLDKKNGYRMQYLTGSVESPKINKAIVDILEGTMPAFDNRDSKYHEINLS
ncbi:MAG TPA: DNA repair protein [Verrucomicrobiae bacterium]|nr:DNA repair protein [Verrucomicrobiae bacterium]